MDKKKQQHTLFTETNYYLKPDDYNPENPFPDKYRFVMKDETPSAVILLRYPEV